MYFKNEAGEVFVKNGSIYVELEMYSMKITPKIDEKESHELFLKNEFEANVKLLEDAVK